MPAESPTARLQLTWKAKVCTTGTFISNRIAYHISSSLNWGLAAALGSILLALVLTLYWLYDRIVGIDNVKLGG